MGKKEKIAEYRAESTKSLLEQRNDKISEMETLVGAAKSETRAMTEDEQIAFDTLDAEIRAIDATLDKEEKARNISVRKPDETIEEQRAEEAEFDDFLRGRRTSMSSAELRADAQSTGLNENIIPSQFSSDIIRRVVELSGIITAVSKINSKGIYKQIIEGNRIQAGWTAELAEVMRSTADFSIVEIGHHKLGALVKLSEEIINQSEVPIINEVITQMVDDFTLKAEEAIVKGDGAGRPHGLLNGGTVFQPGTPGISTADDFVKIFHALKSPYMPNAKWLINRNTLCAIRLLKDANGRYLFHEGELTSGYAGYILGKPVILSEVMDDYQILFGDFARAYKANINPQMTIQVLNELFISQGARGIIGFMWLDGRPVNNEAYVVSKSIETFAKKK